jgi:protein ImuA
MIAQLRQSLRALQKPAGIDDGPGALPLGIAAIDAMLGGGLARCALHEIAAAGEAHVAAAAGFAIGVACLPSPRSTPLVIPGRPPKPEGRRRTSPESITPTAEYGFRVRRFAPSRNDEERAGRGGLVWIAEDMALAESGAPYGPGLEAFGLAPERLLTVAAAQTRDLLWAMEEALRCRAVGAVIGELRHGEIDMVAVRRLSLAAAQSGALALLLRGSPPHDASTAATRWVVSAAPHDCFAVQLTRNRRGPLGAWTLQWSDDDERFVPATHAQPVAEPAADRPHRQDTSEAA